MHRSYLLTVLYFLLNCRRSTAHPALQADTTPCPTTVLLPEATLTINPGPSNAIVSGLRNGATSTLEVNGPAITIGSRVLSLNGDRNLDLDDHVYLFDGVCPALLIPVMNTGPMDGDPESSSSTIIPIAPGPTGTSPENNNPGTSVVPLVPIPVPNIPEIPNLPSGPDTPDTPKTPDTPSPPGTPSAPDTPSKPNPPSDPDTPTAPHTPEVPDPPVAPIAPIITPPPTPPGETPNGPAANNPEECETKSASICPRECSFGVDDNGATTTTSCADPTCTATAGCTASDSTSTSTIEDACSLISTEIADGYPFEVDGDGPLPILRSLNAGTPAPVDPSPTSDPQPSVQPDPDPSPTPDPQPDPKPDPNTNNPPPDQPAEVQPPQRVFEAGDYVDAQGTKSSALFARYRESKLNVCADSPLYAQSDYTGTFDLPDSYSNCKFQGSSGGDLGIFCEGQDKVPCVASGVSSVSNCLGNANVSFRPLWVCNG